MFLIFAALRLAVRRALSRIIHRAPVAHQGATEAFATELRGLRDIEVSPELISDIETELQWGQIWHDFETHLQAEVDRIFAPALAFADCLTFDEVRELVGYSPVG